MRGGVCACVAATRVITLSPEVASQPARAHAQHFGFHGSTAPPFPPAARSALALPPPPSPCRYVQQVLYAATAEDGNVITRQAQVEFAGREYTEEQLPQ